MHVNLHLRVSVKDPSADLSCHLHGIHRIALINSSALNLEGASLVGIYSVNEVNNRLANSVYIRKVVLSVSFYCHSRTDSGYSKDSLKCGNCLIKIKACGLDIYSSCYLGNLELSVALCKNSFDLLNKSVLKDVSVLALNSYLCVFDNKSMVLHIILLNACKTFSWFLSVKRGRPKGSRSPLWLSVWTY